MFDHLTNTLLRGEGVATGSLLLVSGLVVALALRGLVAVGHRQRLRTPTLLVVFGAGSMIALDFIVPSPNKLQRWLSVVPVALLLLAFGRLVSVAVFDWILARRLQTESPRILRDIVDGFFTAVALLVTLGAMGVEPGSLLTTSAVLTAVLGLSLQDTLGNLFAGLSLQWQRPFTVGDWIQVDKEGTQLGRVLEVNWRATRLITGDSQELIIPNSQLARSVILNHSRPSQDSARAVKVTLPYEVPTQRAQAILLRATEGVNGIVAEPKPKVVTVAFLDQGVQYEVRFQIRDFAERGAIETTIRDRIWYVLHRAELPFAHGVNKLSSLASAGADVDAQRTERARALRRIDFLRDLPDASIATLAAASRTEPYAPGEYVIRQGDVSEELYLCLSGELVVLHQGELDLSRQQREVARLHSGGLFGEFAQLTGQARAATVQAATSCELVVVDKAAFTQVLRENPALAELISERLAERRAELDAVGRATPELKRATVARHKGQFLQKLREFFLD